MSSIAQTQPRTGRRNFTLRAYLAGTAATAALLGAVVLVFASLGAYVAFNGLPIGGDSGDSDAASVAVGHTVAAPSQQNTRKQVSNAEVHRSNGGASNQGSQHGSGSAGGHSVEATPSPATATATAGTSTPTDSTGGGGDSTTTASPAQGPTAGDPPTSPTLPTPQVTTPDSVGGTVGNVEQTLHQVGVDVPLTGQGSAVDEVTDSVLGGN